MAPPTYGDLGKNARDVFGKGYHFGLLKLDVKTKTDSGVEFSSGGVSNQDTGKVFGTLESKYKIKEYGLTFVEKWNTDNTLGADITLADKPLQGLTIGYSSTFSPQTGNKTGKLKTTYKHENIAATADFDLSLSAGPLINASAVVGYQSWLAGYQVGFDSQTSKITKNNFALGFNASDFHLHTSVDNGREFGGSIHHKIKPDLEGAINLAWNSSNNVTQFGLGTKYDLDRDVSVRAKINSQLQIGLGYQQKLHSGVSLTLSANIDGKNFGSGGHKVGFALELEA
ncbi:voltage-dependent anion-selective channel-like [Trichogramma pretiosum]|uniref:Voltage-dependent anion-selective channel n=1 Tax=Trichogramma kaykai TaxID=54128 RepID=A0ABD2W178_9HYME|nr:voltage-dependent anion-selective channel-like [Trichogramma pretiosum]XP_014224293.1 voltage-dependent anion-selective channel-like [Trichogramma pretiosum]XP_014224294.1 voltage-dependent anion-selective channel-like [Trichogramma pretiosum]XP_014224295.1 voltage-dependent anion-selective channel-like [Trichogramma pretiosum]